MRKLKLLLTNKSYRWATFESLKLKLMSFPLIKNVVSWYYAYKMYNKMKNMSPWEQHQIKRKEINDSKKFCFLAALIRLKICIMAKGENKELFEAAKSDILCNEIINEKRFKDFKEWLESVNSTEKDHSKIDEIINSLTP